MPRRYRPVDLQWLPRPDRRSKQDINVSVEVGHVILGDFAAENDRRLSKDICPFISVAHRVINGQEFEIVEISFPKGNLDQIPPLVACQPTDKPQTDMSAVCRRRDAYH